jgi:hypothetical protein
MGGIEWKLNSSKYRSVSMTESLHYHDKPVMKRGEWL